MTTADTPRKKPNHTFDSSNTRHKVTQMLGALTEPKTYDELQLMLHMSKRSVHFYIEHLRQPPNQRVYKKAYRLVNGRYHAVFALGARKDAAMPARQTEAEKKAKWRAKVKSDPDLQARRQLYEKARWLMKRPKVKQSPFSALGL